MDLREHLTAWAKSIKLWLALLAILGGWIGGAVEWAVKMAEVPGRVRSMQGKVGALQDSLRDHQEAFRRAQQALNLYICQKEHIPPARCDIHNELGEGSVIPGGDR